MRLFSKPPPRSALNVQERLLYGSDFFRMVVAAVVVGLVFSAAAATLTLLLAGATDANAARGAAVTASHSPPDGAAHKFLHHPNAAAGSGARIVVARPGVAIQHEPNHPPAVAMSASGKLWMLDGCGGSLIDPGEHDIQITIHQNRAEIQVMQTFMIASNDQGTKQTALFRADLPKAAYFHGMRVQTDSAMLIGQFSSGGNWDLDEPAGSEQLTSRGLIRYFHSHQLATSNTITTAPLTQLGGGDSIVVIYQYQIPVVPNRDISAISLALLDVPTEREGDDSNHQRWSPTNIATSIWVIWMAPPKQIYRPPVGLTIERSADQTARIEAASWQSSTRPGDGKFQLAWIH